MPGPVGDEISPQRLRQRLGDAAILANQVAHDFGNVFTSILGFAELALTQLPAQSPSHRHLTEVYQSAQEGFHLIQRLQALGRHAPSRPQASDLASLSDQVESYLHTRNGTARLAIHVDLPQDLPRVALDGEALRQLLNQLLDNAREAITGAGQVAVTARVVTLTDDDCRGLLGAPAPGLCVALTVHDTGRGLSDDVRRGLASEAFFSTKPRRRGLGLAVVCGILQAYRGGFQLESQPGMGTSAHVYLPVALATGPEASSSTNHVGRATP